MKTVEKLQKINKLIGFFGISLIGAGLIIMAVSSFLMAAEGPTPQSNGLKAGLGFIAMGLATGMAAIGAGIGVAQTGSAAIGAVSEKPELLGRTLVFVGLAEGIAIYGILVAILIFIKI